MLEIQQDNKDGIHVWVQGDILKFMMLEFSIIIGLKCTGNIDEYMYTSSLKSSLRSKYFPNTIAGIPRSKLIQCVKMGNFDNSEDALNLAILYFVHAFLFSQHRKSPIILSHFQMVEDGREEVQRLDLSFTEDFEICDRLPTFVASTYADQKLKRLADEDQQHVVTVAEDFDDFQHYTTTERTSKLTSDIEEIKTYINYYGEKMIDKEQGREEESKNWTVRLWRICRYFFVNQGMKYHIDKVPAHPLHMGSLCNRAFGEDIKTYFGEDVFGAFKNIILGVFLDMLWCNLIGQISKCLLMLEIQQDNKDEIHVWVQGDILKFMMLEFSIIIGLKCIGNIDEYMYTSLLKSSLRSKYFPNTIAGIPRSKLIQCVKMGNFDNSEDALNLAILYFVHAFLFSQHRKSPIILSHFQMVEDGRNIIPRIFNWSVKCTKPMYKSFMAGMFSKFSYKNLKPTSEEVQRLDLSFTEDFEICDRLPTFVASTYADQKLKSTIPPQKVLIRGGLSSPLSAEQASKRRKTVMFQEESPGVKDDEKATHARSHEDEAKGPLTEITNDDPVTIQPVDTNIQACVNTNTECTIITDVQSDQKDNVGGIITDSVQDVVDATLFRLSNPSTTNPLDVVTPNTMTESQWTLPKWLNKRSMSPIGLIKNLGEHKGHYSRLPARVISLERLDQRGLYPWHGIDTLPAEVTGSEAQDLDDVEKSRGENAAPVTWLEFQSAFLDRFFLLDMREAKVEEFMNLRQGSMTMKEYCLKFNQLAKYAPNLIADPRASMSKFVTGVSGLVLKECRAAMPYRDKNLTRLLHLQLVYPHLCSGVLDLRERQAPKPRAVLVVFIPIRIVESVAGATKETGDDNCDKPSHPCGLSPMLSDLGRFLPLIESQALEFIQFQRLRFRGTGSRVSLAVQSQSATVAILYSVQVQISVKGYLVVLRGHKHQLPNELMLDYSQWIFVGLLKYHDGIDCGVFVAGYAEILKEGLEVHSCGFDAESQCARYASLLCHYEVRKANEAYTSDNDDPPRPKNIYLQSIYESSIVTLE
ncbi:putative hyoscyamine 6-dioxygenase-like [Capsicum annuum]|nr:putative hyoscyamine 6-dioxygenase-like [Capsicum annuum]